MDEDLENKELNSLLVSGRDLLRNSGLNFVDRINFNLLCSGINCLDI